MCVRRVASQILRLALKSPEFRRILVAEFKGRPEFRQEVEGKRFRNPNTGNKVLFDSLPNKEQRRIYLEWWRSRRPKQETPKDEKALAEKRTKIEESNPWAVPLWEYYDIVQEDAGKKWHAPGEIATQTIKSLEWMGAPKEDDVKIGERKFGNDLVSFYRSTEPRKYVKRDEDGDLARDPETGDALYLSEKEMLERGLPLFDTALRAYVGDTPIGSVADEWGATLVQVAEEYQKKGIGKFLSKLWRKAFPFKGSGGFSAQGLSTFKRVYQDFVREALHSGEYDRAMKEGWMTPRRFADILESAGLDPTGNSAGEPRIEEPSRSGSKELVEARRELAEAGSLMREMDWGEGDYTDDQKENHRKKFRALLDKAMKLEEAEKQKAEDTASARSQRMTDLADAYWKAKQRGDTEEAQRIWDLMGTV